MKSYRKKIFDFIKSEYGIEPEFPWEKFPTYGVLRNGKNKKWFGVLMSIPKNKLGLKGGGEIDVMNIKCEPMGVLQLLDEGKGFLPAYHMNKKYWITVFLDGTVSLSRIKTLLQMSYALIAKKGK